MKRMWDMTRWVTVLGLLAMGCAHELTPGVDPTEQTMDDPLQATAPAGDEEPADEPAVTPVDSDPVTAPDPVAGEPVDSPEEPEKPERPERPEEPVDEPDPIEPNPPMGDDLSDESLGTLRGVWVSDSGELFVGGDEGQVHRWNDKQGWLAHGDAAAGALLGLHGRGETVVAVGENGAILRDGKAESSGASADLNGVWFTDKTQGYGGFAVGDDGTVLHSSWEGEWWKMYAFADGGDVTANLNAVWGADNWDVFAVGDAGTVLRFNGKHWGQVNVDLEGDLVGVSGTTYAGSYELWIVAADGSIARGNEEQMWVYDEALPGVTSLAMGAFSPTVVGHSGAAWKMSGKAMSWFDVDSGTDADLHAVTAFDGVAWAVGSGGAVVAID